MTHCSFCNSKTRRLLTLKTGEYLCYKCLSTFSHAVLSFGQPKEK